MLLLHICEVRLRLTSRTPYVKSHHTAVSAHISKGQSKLSGPARVHAKLKAQRLAARSGETQGSDSGMAHRNPDWHQNGTAASRWYRPAACSLLGRGRDRGWRSPAARAESHDAGPSKGVGSSAAQVLKRHHSRGAVRYINSTCVWRRQIYYWMSCGRLPASLTHP